MKNSVINIFLIVRNCRKKNCVEYTRSPYLINRPTSNFLNFTNESYINAYSSHYFFNPIVQGMLYPCCHGIIAKWAPPLERSRLATLALAGSYAGAVVGPALSGVLTEYVHWATSFYVFGLFSLLWYWVWSITIFDGPTKDPFLSSSEKEYILTTIGTKNKNKITSLSKFKKIIKKPIIVLLI